MSKKQSTFILAGLFLALQSATALAQTNCTSFPGSDFGAVQLGSLYAAVPKSFTRLPECVMSAQYPEAICAWLDPKTGIEYDGFTGMITRKQITIGPNNPNPQMPFGLTPKDSATEAQKKIKALANAPSLRVVKTATGSTRVDTSCIKGNKVEMLKIQMEFDAKGAMTTLFVTIPAGDVAPDPGKPNRPQF